MPVRQAAAIWTVVFLIGLTGGELLRQQTLDHPALASTSGSTEPTAAISAPASGAAVPTATYTATTAMPIATYTATTTTTPPQPTTMVECDGSSCPDHPSKQESRTEDGESGRGHGKGGKGRGQGKDGKSGKG
jgi:hypothetical protein